MTPRIPNALLETVKEGTRRLVRNDGLPGRIGLPDGTVYFTDPAGDQVLWMVYVRIGNPGNYSDVTVAYSNGVAVYYDMPVRVVNIDGTPYITTEDGRRAVWWSGDVVGAPLHRHDRLSANPIYLEALAFTPLLVMPTNPTTMTVDIQPGYYRYEGTGKNFAGDTSADLSAYVPANINLIHWVLLYLDRSDNTVKVQDGEDINITIQSSITRANVLFSANELDAHDYPLAAVAFYYGQTTITAHDIIYDARLWGLEYSATGFDISGLTEETDIDGAADWLPFYDTTAGDNRKIHPVDLPGGTGNVSLLWSQVEDVTVANTTDETAVIGSGRGSKTIPADTLAQGVTLRLLLGGHLSDTGNPTLDIKVTIGGTEVCSTGANNIDTSITDVDFHITVAITCRSAGASGTVVASGLFEHDNGTSFGMVKTTATTIDTTAALAVDVTATWGTASASNTITCQEATIELLAVDGLALAAPSGLEATEV